MVDHLIYFLREALGLKIPLVFHYTSSKMMLAAMTSLLISIFLGPRFIKRLYEMKIGQYIRREECPPLAQLHAKKQDTPTMGGILILVAMTVSLLLWMDLKNIYTIILLITTLFFGFLGGIDDYLKLKHRNSKGLSGRKKLFAQLFLSSVIGLYLLYPPFSQSLQFGSWFHPPEHLQENALKVYLPFFKDPVFILSGFLGILSFFLIVFVITGSSNAVNLTDGLDGLASGCLLMVAVCLALIAFVSNNKDLAAYLNIPYLEGSGEIAIYLSGFAGACLGFLWYNSHPAQVFMGDTGSLALGGVIGVSAVLLRREFLLAVIGGIFVAEALSVICQVLSFKFRNKKRVLLCAPLHHHFEYKGWPETKVVIRFWIIGLLLAIVGMASLKFQ